MKKEWAELISDPIAFNENTQRVFEHDKLPVVEDELSVTLRLKLKSHTSDWATIFHKGTETFVQTPGFWLTANKSALHARFTGNWNSSAGIEELGDGLLLDKWYHLTYTLSDPEKRLDIYIDSEWVGFYCMQNVKTQNVVFNDGPLYIGCTFAKGFNGVISNVRYYNWRLCAQEVKEDFFNKLIVYGSKVALVHVSTNKYLSTNGIKYPQLDQYMVVGNGRKIDLNNDVWNVIGPCGTSVNAGRPVPYNTIVGFNHQATGRNLHSHDMKDGRFTPITKQQQVTINPGTSIDDDFLIRRYNSKAFKDDPGYLMNGDIIYLFHITTNKPALYSNSILFGDGTQEVSCHGNGNDENNKWRIEFINDSKL